MPGAGLFASIGYSVGFLIVVLGRLQLFTEATITAVLPVVTEFSRERLARTARLWGVVFGANLIGMLVAAASTVFSPTRRLSTPSSRYRSRCWRGLGGRRQSAARRRVLDRGHGVDAARLGRQSILGRRHDDVRHRARRVQPCRRRIGRGPGPVARGPLHPRPSRTRLHPPGPRWEHRRRNRACSRCLPTRRSRRSFECACLVVAPLSRRDPTGLRSQTPCSRTSGADQRLRSIEIEGNDALADKAIEPHLNSTETQWFPLPELHYVNPGILPSDARRIETLYERRGFYDARVLRYDVEDVRKGKAADVRFEVEEGEPTTVESIEFHWPDGHPGGPADRAARPEKIQTRCGLQIGAPFDVEEMHASESTMGRRPRRAWLCLRRGRLRAPRSIRDLRTARVDFELRPGPYVHIGRIAIRGSALRP